MATLLCVILTAEPNWRGWDAGQLQTTPIGRMTMVTLGGVKASPSIVIASPSPINPISEKLWYTVIRKSTDIVGWV